MGKWFILAVMIDSDKTSIQGLQAMVTIIKFMLVAHLAYGLLLW